MLYDDGRIACDDMILTRLRRYGREAALCMERSAWRRQAVGEGRGPDEIIDFYSRAGMRRALRDDRLDMAVH